MRTFRGVIAVGLAVVGIGLPLSPTGLAYLSAAITWLVAPLMPRKDERARKGSTARRMALVLVALTAAFRWWSSPALDGDGLRIIDEADIAVPAAALLPLVEPDARGLRPAMAARYRAMRNEAGEVPTPLLHSWLGRNAVLRTEPANPETYRLGVVFLHGYAGNFALPCWEVGAAVREVGGAIRCPSSGFTARWRSIDRVRAQIEDLRDHGAEKVVLAGISAGAIGASRLAPRLRGEIDGLVLLAGVAGRTRRPGVPVLTIGGRRDGMTSPVALRRYGRRHGRHVELQGGHFALLHEHAVAHEAMVEFFGRFSE